MGWCTCGSNVVCWGRVLVRSRHVWAAKATSRGMTSVSPFSKVPIQKARWRRYCCSLSTHCNKPDIVHRPTHDLRWHCFPVQYMKSDLSQDSRFTRTFPSNLQHPRGSVVLEHTTLDLPSGARSIHRTSEELHDCSTASLPTDDPLAKIAT